MSVIPADATRIYVALDEDGTPGAFALVADLNAYSAVHGSEDPSETFVYGSDEPYTKAGENTDEYSADGLLNLADTDGQNVLRISRDEQQLIWVKVLQDGTNGVMQKARTTEYQDNGEREGDFVLCSFTIQGVAGTMVTIPES